MADQHTPSVNTKELFYCEQHGMIEPGRFDPGWYDELGCPVLTGGIDDRCGESVLPVDLSGVLAPGNIRRRLTELQRYDIYADRGTLVDEEYSQGDWVLWEHVFAAFSPDASGGER